VAQLYHKHGNTAVSWLRVLFHDCMVGSCDASLLLDTSPAAGVSEKSAPRSFGMRNFKYVDVIKAALERECPGTVSCADVLALAARDGAAALGGPRAAAIPMRTGRRDARRASSYADVARDIPNHNDTVSVVLARFAAAGVDAEGAVALLGAHSVGRVHCFNLVARLYPAVEAGLDPAYGEYLRGRCPTADAREDTRDVAYARNDRATPMTLDNMYYKNLLARRGLLLVDQRLADDPRTAPFVAKFAADNGYFHERFAAALITLSENNPLGADEGEVRRDCRFVNPA
jgi:peroxidase